MTLPAAAAPIADRDRLPVLDILRGFALFGIFLMNIEFFTRTLQTYSGGVAPSEGWDYAFGLAIYVAVQGKFWVLFALLFGMGFALMRDRASTSGRPFFGLHLRRTLLLALFGALHIAFVWVGDILLAYAMTALLLLALAWLRGTAAWVVGGGLYLGVAVLWLLFGMVLMAMPESTSAMVRAEMLGLVAEADRAATVYREGGFLEITRQRLSDYQVVATGALPFQIPMMLGVFLLGRWLVGTGYLADPSANRGFFLKLALGGVLFGLMGVAGSLSLGAQFDLVEDVAASTVAAALMSLGNLPLALGYLAIVVLLASGPLRAPLALLAPAGRMALTNYLLQSIVGTFIFYGYGLGQWGEIGRSGQVAIVVAVVGLQVVFSHWWLSRFRLGPIEWLWRAGTYLQVPPMRRIARA